MELIIHPCPNWMLVWLVSAPGSNELIPDMPQYYVKTTKARRVNLLTLRPSRPSRPRKTALCVRNTLSILPHQINADYIGNCLHRAQIINPSVAEFISGNIKISFKFSIISQHGIGTGYWNPSWWKTRIYLSCIFNIMAVDVLATQGARASAAMVLT